MPSTQTWCHGTPKKCASRADCNDRGDCADGICACDAGFEGFTCNATVIKKVHAIQSCHLDAGFTDTTAGVLNTYFTRHLPNAIATAAALRNDSSLPDGWRLKFMAQSFYVALYLHCPTYIEGLTCPTEAEKQALIAALKDGSIYYHAFPNNAELENMSPTLLREGLRASRMRSTPNSACRRRARSPAAGRPRRAQGRDPDPQRVGRRPHQRRRQYRVHVPTRAANLPMGVWRDVDGRHVAPSRVRRLLGR